MVTGRSQTVAIADREADRAWLRETGIAPGGTAAVVPGVHRERVITAWTRGSETGSKIRQNPRFATQGGI